MLGITLGRFSRQTTIATGLLVAATLATLLFAVATRDRPVAAAFWFEPITYGSEEAMVGRLGGPISDAEMAVIAALAWNEVATAFTGLRVVFSEPRDATYRVRVVQELQNARSPRYPGPAGESRSLGNLGGQGAVSFRMLASNAIVYAAADATRTVIIEGIGRGIGRAAVHEFAHLLLGTAPIHRTDDPASYEYESSYRREQYYGSLHWDIAGPLLQKRLGARATP